MAAVRIWICADATPTSSGAAGAGKTGISGDMPGVRVILIPFAMFTKLKSVGGGAVVLGPTCADGAGAHDKQSSENAKYIVLGVFVMVQKFYHTWGRQSCVQALSSAPKPAGKAGLQPRLTAPQKNRGAPRTCKRMPSPIIVE